MAVQDTYRRPTGERTVTRMTGGRFKGGKLAPSFATVVRESEAGLLTQSAMMELDPIAGRMASQITAGVVSVFVPVQAMDALKNPSQDYPGSADVVRAKLLSGAVLFDLEPENEISKRADVAPRSVAGVKLVNESVRLAHNVAVNYLRQRKYVKATLLNAANTAMTPALISRTVLDRLNAVLDPEDRIDGKVDFTGQIPVRGIGIGSAVPAEGTHTGILLSDSPDGSLVSITGRSAGNAQFLTEGGIPQVFADLAGADGVSLRDFYRAERMDALTRQMRTIVDDNPQYGEELAVRWAYGLESNVGAQPVVLYEKEEAFGADYRRAMDGANMDVSRTESGHAFNFSVPIPKTEFGGIVITFLYVKPDEALAAQPDPYLSETWHAQNFVADELALDPVPVTARELWSDVDTADEGNVMLYVGNNHLKKDYVRYGWNRQLDKTTVEAKTSIWQLDVPMSVTPDSIVYPDDLEQYPFQDQLAEICTYTLDARARFATPTVFGPVPVEELSSIEDADVFEDAE